MMMRRERATAPMRDGAGDGNRAARHGGGLAPARHTTTRHSTTRRHRGDLTVCALVPEGHAWRRVALAEGVEFGSGVQAQVRLPRLARRQCLLRAKGDSVLVRDLTGDGLAHQGRRLGASARLPAGTVLRLAGVPVVLLSQRGEGDWLQAGGLGSASPEMWRAMAELALAGESGAPLLICGESGVGKELASRFAHQVSPRASAPFVALNCAALPAGLLESELFGSRRGAYTGSVDHRAGAFARADGGTLLLDEVGELSAAAQAALLRVLETGEVQVVGGEAHRVDVRVIAATHRDLHRAVAEGRFRLDLLHRLGVAEVRLPALRARPADIPALLGEFLGATLPAGAPALLRRHRWPGNVRELRNVARRIAMRCGGQAPTLAEVQRAMGELPTREAASDRRALVQRLLQVSPSVAAAQRASGLPRSTFFRYMKALREAERSPAMAPAMLAPMTTTLS